MREVGTSRYLASEEGLFPSTPVGKTLLKEHKREMKLFG